MLSRLLSASDSWPRILRLRACLVCVNEIHQLSHWFVFGLSWAVILPILQLPPIWPGPPGRLPKTCPSWVGRILIMVFVGYFTGWQCRGPLMIVLFKSNKNMRPALGRDPVGATHPRGDYHVGLGTITLTPGLRFPPMSLKMGKALWCIALDAAKPWRGPQTDIKNSAMKRHLKGDFRMIVIALNIGPLVPLRFYASCAWRCYACWRPQYRRTVILRRGLH